MTEDKLPDPFVIHIGCPSIWLASLVSHVSERRIAIKSCHSRDKIQTMQALHVQTLLFSFLLQNVHHTLCERD